jgi:ABC-type spermidine/putrescine transport system permease subunit I
MLLGGVFSLAGLAILSHDYFGGKAFQISPLENMEMVVWATSAVIGMAGAYFVVFRRDLGIALTASVFCAIAGFPVYYVGMIPGIAAAALLVLSREEFQ